MLEIDVISLFPRLFEAFLGESFVGLAQERERARVTLHDLREWTTDRHRTVDDSPYGGGPGMLMKPEPLVAAIEALAGVKGAERRARVVLLSPQGKRLDQQWLQEASRAEHLVIVCGRYEGVDQRAIDLAVDEEISLGDFVLCGGEIPAMALIEGMMRLLPGVLGNPESVLSESFGGDLLEGPQYTRPAEFRGQAVPEVLLSGDHAMIARWREEKAVETTRRRRPDLMVAAQGKDGR
ncbi:MAG: tRNA (guanosine(37)-N1)-methyltransferase TrmD [Deltaproteobacteria bacterium]|nr:tRNA (guanosine(37)-N1)-methyltransferase TrmD [Deltaproteobacteria bacterium]MBW2419012.1 tRNA (guanosine(37)-N1)-methyltransferase TrmD [Deltaproteobacteria bacterium]